jgi:hypothetical protein
MCFIIDLKYKTKLTFSKNMIALSYVLFDLSMIFSLELKTNERMVVPPASTDRPIITKSEMKQLKTE